MINLKDDCDAAVDEDDGDGDWDNDDFTDWKIHVKKEM